MRWLDSEAQPVALIYGLYLLPVAAALTSFLGVGLALMRQGNASHWLKSHHRWQIRTFLIGFVGVIVGWLLKAVLIGWLVLALVAVWWVARNVKGLIHLGRREPVSDVDGFFV